MAHLKTKDDSDRYRIHATWGRRRPSVNVCGKKDFRTELGWLAQKQCLLFKGHLINERLQRVPCRGGRGQRGFGESGQGKGGRPGV